MNAQADDAACTAQDTELLTTIDQILEERGADHPDDPTSLHGYCTGVARAVPKANPAFQEMLSRRLAVEVERRGRGRHSLGRISWLRIRRPASPLKPLSALLALLLVGGAGGYLRLQSPTPVDARTLLSRVASTSPGPGQAIHETFRLSATGGITGSTDVWMASDTKGIPTRFALTQSIRGDSPAQDESGRLVQTPDLFEVYDPTNNTVTRSVPGVELRSSASASRPTVQDLEGMLVATMVAQKLSRAFTSGLQPGTFQLGRQSLDGISVYTFKLSGANLQAFYFNAQSYILEGADWTQGGRSWQARLDPGSYRSMALGSVPPGTFSLNAPASAQVVVLPAPSEQTKGQSGDDMITTMAAACDTTPQAFKDALQAGTSSLLAVCRQTTPSMTADQLVAALMATEKTQLDDQVASGSITAAEEATDLSNLRIKLTATITGQPGPGAPGASPK